MSRVLALHGVAASIDPQRFAYRNLVNHDTLTALLTSCPRLVSLDAALAGRGDALTIDDGTRAGADAALLARSLGHEVALFVNPEQVESGEPYSFVLLNTLLDALRQSAVEFHGRTFHASTVKGKQTLRREIKRVLQQTPDERGRREFIVALASNWASDALRVPPHFATLTKMDLVQLHGAGVDLQNHGWSHTSHAALAADASDREVRDGRDWLERELGVNARYFAVPFGDVPPPAGGAPRCDAWLMLTDELPAGFRPPNVFNREELSGVGDASAKRTQRWWPFRLLKRMRRA
jgi:hypothetical protein